jgi:porin
VLELTYQAVLAPWLVVQPDVQYVFHPGGGGARSADPAATIPDALVIGLRTTLKL